MQHLNSDAVHLISDEAMEILTGETVKKNQCENLRQNGIRFSTTSTGRPRLTWEAYNRQLCGSYNPIQELLGPNLSKL